MKHGITIIDHPVIGVRDMAAARSAYERLGFIVPPRGSHPQWGTGNWCIMFERDYLEIRGALDPAKAATQAHGLMDFLARREGLMGVAFGTIGAQETHDLLAAAGLNPKPVKSLTRNFELSEGSVPVSFNLCFLEATATPGLMLVAFCEHLTRDRMRRPEWLQHPNGARGICGLYAIVENVNVLAPAHERLFGAQNVHRRPGEIHVDFEGGGFVALLEEHAMARRFPGLRLPPRTEWPCLAAVSLVTDSVGNTAAYLQARGIKAVVRDECVFVLPEAACGAPIEFASR